MATGIYMSALVSSMGRPPDTLKSIIDGMYGYQDSSLSANDSFALRVTQLFSRTVAPSLNEIGLCASVMDRQGKKWC